MKTIWTLLYLLGVSMTALAQPEFTWSAVFFTQDAPFTASCAGGDALDDHSLAYVFLDNDGDGPDPTDAPPWSLMLPGLIWIEEDPRYRYANFALTADGTMESPRFDGERGLRGPQGPLHVYLRVYIGEANDSCYTSPVAVIPEDGQLTTITFPRDQWSCGLAERAVPRCHGSLAVMEIVLPDTTPQCAEVCDGSQFTVVVLRDSNWFTPPLLRLEAGCGGPCQVRELHFAAGTWRREGTDRPMWWSAVIEGRDVGCLTVRIIDETAVVRLDTMTATVINETVELRWRTTSESALAYWQIWRPSPVGGYIEHHIADLQAAGEPEGFEYAYTDSTAFQYGHRIAYLLVALDQEGVEYGVAYLDVLGSLAASPPITPTPHSLLLSSYPNPFNPSTTISLTIPQTGRTTVAVYDVLGRAVRTLQDGVLERGEHSLAFDGGALPSGLYFARVVSGEFVATQKMLLLK